MLKPKSRKSNKSKQIKSLKHSDRLFFISGTARLTW